MLKHSIIFLVFTYFTIVRGGSLITETPVTIQDVMLSKNYSQNPHSLDPVGYHVLDDDDNGKNYFSDSTSMLLHYIHGGVMLALWGVCADLAIMQARYHKNNKNFANIHGLIMASVSILTIISGSLVIWLS